jgi:hypothetical protein
MLITLLLFPDIFLSFGARLVIVQALAIVCSAISAAEFARAFS